MKKSIERIVYTAIFTGALLSIQNNLAYAKPGDVYDLGTGFKFAKEHVTSNNSVVSLLEEKIQKGDKIVKELPDSRFIYVEGFKTDYERYLKLNFNQEEALIKAIESNILTNQEELDKIKNSKDFFEQNTSLAVDVNGDIIKVSGNTLEGNLLINVYDMADKEVYIGHVKNNESGYYEYAFDFGGNTTGNYKVVVQESILENKKESNIEYREQEIKEIPKLEDVIITYGTSYELPKAVEILTQDKGIAEGNYIKNAMVVWDKEFDNKKQGKQEFNGKLLNVTTTQGIQLNIIVGEQDSKEAVNERFKKLDDLMKQDIDFVEEKINTEINQALNSVQEALDNQNLKDEEFKKSMQEKVDIYSDAIDKINTLKTDIESFEELLLNGDFTNKEVNDEYNAYYEKFVDVYKNFNKATYTSVRARKEASENWYVKNNYEFSHIKVKILSDLYILHRDMNYLEDNEKQERYNKIEEFRTICNNIGHVDKYKFNRATTNSLENIKQDLINKVEAIIVDNGGLKLNKGTETNKIEATFVGIKIKDLGSYEIEILDEDQYGNNVKVYADGTITLDSDKGNDDNAKYEQIIVIKDPLWNVQYPIKVAITDNEGKDTFEIVNENINKIVSLEQFQNVTLNIGDTTYKLPTQVKVKMLDNSEMMVNVTWDKELSTESEGEFEFIGSVEGTTLTTSIRVEIKQFDKLQLLEHHTENLEKTLGDSIDLSDENKLNKAKDALATAEDALEGVEETQEKEALKERIEQCKKLINLIVSINGNINLLNEKENTIVRDKYSTIKAYEDVYRAIDIAINEVNNITRNNYLENLKKSKDNVRANIYFTGNLRAVAISGKSAIKVIFAGEEITNLSEYVAYVYDNDRYGEDVSVDLTSGKVKLDNDLLHDDGKVYKQEISLSNLFWDIPSKVYVEIKDVSGKDQILVNNIEEIYEIKDIDLEFGQECKLPNIINGKDTNGKNIELSVEWNYSNVNINLEGQYIATGILEDTFRTVEVKVNVKSLTLEEKLQIKMENLNRVFGDDVDLLSFGNIQKGENAILEAEDIIAQAEKEGIDVSEEKTVVEKAKDALREINSVLQQINECNEYIDTEDLSNCRYSEWGEGESRIEEINSKYTEIAYKVYWAGADNPINIEHKLTKLTVEGIRTKLEEINVKHDSIKVNLIIELKSIEELNILLNEFKEDTTNIEKYNDLNNKLNEPSNYDGLNETTIHGFQSKREAIKNELDQITKGIQSTTSSAITIRLDQLSTEKRSKNGQATSNSDSNSNGSRTYLREEDLLGLKRIVIDNIQEFIKKISRKLK